MIARQTVLRPLAIVGALLTGIAPASAHGFAGPGWLHPLTGPDHMLAMLAVECGVERLSMGMSGDFETAVAFGATSVRVGSAIFGTR